MITVNRKVSIQWKLNYSVFEQINRVPFATPNYPIGAHLKAVNTLSADGELLKKTLPTVVQTSVTDSSWQSKVSDWLYDFHLDIPKGGLPLNTGYFIDIDNEDTKQAIAKLIEDNRKDEVFSKMFPLTKYHEEEVIEKDKDGKEVTKIQKGTVDVEFTLEDKDLHEVEKLVEIFIRQEIAKRTDIRQGLEKINIGEGKVTEEQLHKYVTFINPKEYIQWRYCLLHNIVANKLEDINKSPKIRFFMSSEEQDKAARATEIKLRNSALLYYNKLTTGPEADIDNLLIASGQIGDWSEYKAMDIIEKQSRLLNMLDSDSATFLVNKDDKNLSTKATIRKYIWAGLLKYLPDSTIIVDVNNDGKVIGNTMQEAVAYFNNDVNKAYTTELAIKFKKFTN